MKSLNFDFSNLILPDGEIETHGTCTSTSLDTTPGSSPEHINVQVVDEVFSQLYGFPVSKDPVVARGQREQAIIRHKRLENDGLL